jgi:methionine synthase II (cobalamin-independent)
MPETRSTDQDLAGRTATAAPTATAARGRPPFRADHVGSLLRPPELLRARSEFQAGRLGPAGLREIEDRAIRDVVRRQEQTGLRAATDGEFRRDSWHQDAAVHRY